MRQRASGTWSSRGDGMSIVSHFWMFIPFLGGNLNPMIYWQPELFDTKQIMANLAWIPKEQHSRKVSVSKHGLNSGLNS